MLNLKSRFSNGFIEIVFSKKMIQLKIDFTENILMYLFLSLTNVLLTFLFK